MPHDKTFNNKNKLPFVIHACTINDDNSACEEYRDANEPFPTHTHGLHDMGLPEFFVHGRLFGPHGNGALVNMAYEILFEDETLRGEMLSNVRDSAHQGVHITTINTGHGTTHIMARIVSQLHSGVLAAYVTDVNPLAEYIQLFVAGCEWSRDESGFSIPVDLMGYC